MFGELDLEWMGTNNKAIAPLRVSGYGQEHNTSRTTQKKEIEAYCAKFGLGLVDAVPMVESAKESEQRKHYSAVIERALKENIIHVIFHRYDREARNLTDNEANEKHVRTGRMVLHYVADGKVLHKNSPDSDFFSRDINAVVNKQYSRELGTKIRKATKTKAESGWYPGTHPPLGYINLKLKKENGFERQRGTIIAVDPDSKKVKQVLREFELRATSPTPSLKEIRQIVIDEGFIAPDRMTNYRTNTIHKRLSSIFYDDRFEWDGIEYRGNHERIIPSELFWKVQETFGKKSPYGKRTDGLFQNGWLKCGDPNCGCHIVYNPTKKKLKSGDVRTHKYYHCTNGKKVHKSLTGMRVKEDKLLEQFEPAVRQISIKEDFRDQLLEELNKTTKKAKEAGRRDITRYKEALKGLERKEDRAYDNYDQGVIDRPNYEHQINRIRKERSHFTDLMEKTQGMIHEAVGETVESILQLATNAESLWKLATPVERRKLLEQLLYNPVLEGVSVRYEIIKPLRTLSKMKENVEWRIGRQLCDFNRLSG